MSAGAAPVTEERHLRADARRNRDRVLKAARAVFSEHGREAQMQDIARRARVGVGTVYRHFPTKDALLEALIVDRFVALTADARAALDDSDPWEAFTGFMWRAGELQADDRSLSELLSDRACGSSAAAAAMRDELLDAVGQLLERAREAGQVRPGIVPVDAAMIACSIGPATRTPGCTETSWQRYLAIMLDGLRASAASGPLPE